MRELKIISFNIWDLPYWFVRDRRRRVIRIAGYLKKINADVICLQESFDIEHRKLLYEHLGKKRYHVAGGFAPRRKVPFSYMDTTGGLVVFSKFPIKKWKFVPFDHNGYSLIEHIGRKGVLIVTLKTPRGLLEIINTHLHQEGSVLAQRVRYKQIKSILSKFSMNDGSPTIFTGDFNQHGLMQRKKFARILAAERFIHPALSQEEELRPSYRLSNPLVSLLLNPVASSRRLDYILVRSLEQFNLEVTHYAPVYLNPVLSDHDPVLLSLSVPAGR